MEHSYRKLQCWDEAMDLVVQVYDLTRRLPKSEAYGLCSQMRRAAVSIPSNIAEGKQRGSDSELKRFLSIALASGAELETQLELVSRLGLVTGDIVLAMAQQLDKTMALLNALIVKVKSARP